MKIELFLKELRDSADIIYKIYTQGSCFRLYKILKTIDKSAEPYWSDMDGHCITKIGDSFYDIGGKVDKAFIIAYGYYKIDDSLLNGYSLMKYTDNPEDMPVVKVEKYIK